MIDDFAKEYLHSDLREIREAMLWKLDGLAEYDIRRPLTATGTNLLGLVKHLSICGVQVLRRGLRPAVPRTAAPVGRRRERAAPTCGRPSTRRARRSSTATGASWEHSDATITALAIDAPGHVPWWPRPDVKLFNILVHMLTETSRHAGHADILREQLDGSTGTTAECATPQHDAAFWEPSARRSSEPPGPLPTADVHCGHYRR